MTDSTAFREGNTRNQMQRGWMSPEDDWRLGFKWLDETYRALRIDRLQSCVEYRAHVCARSVGALLRYSGPVFSGRAVRTSMAKVWRSRVYTASTNTKDPYHSPPPLTATTPATTMAWNPSSSIFQDGKLKPATYKLQNIVSKTYVGIKDHVRDWTKVRNQIFYTYG